MKNIVQTFIQKHQITKSVSNELTNKNYEQYLEQGIFSQKMSIDLKNKNKPLLL